MKKCKIISKRGNLTPQGYTRIESVVELESGNPIGASVESRH